MTEPPTLRELRDCWWEEEEFDFSLVEKTTFPDDHGYRWTYIFCRHADETYWYVSGVCTGSGDYHELRELHCSDPVQRFPRTETFTRTVFTPQPQEN